MSYFWEFLLRNCLLLYQIFIFLFGAWLLKSFLDRIVFKRIDLSEELSMFWFKDKHNTDKRVKLPNIAFTVFYLVGLLMIGLIIARV